MLRHADTSVCSPEVHDISHHPPPTLRQLSAPPHTVSIGFSGAYSSTCCAPNRHSNPIVHRVRRKRQRLPPSLLIENASERLPLPTRSVMPRRFRSRLATTRELGESPGEIVVAHPFDSSLHSCRSNLSSRYSSAPTRSRRKSSGVKNLYWHLAQEAMEGTCSPYLRTMTKLRSAMAQSAANYRRSRCGSVRGSPVLSSHFSPGSSATSRTTHREYLSWAEDPFHAGQIMHHEPCAGMVNLDHHGRFQTLPNDCHTNHFMTKQSG